MPRANKKATRNYWRKNIFVFVNFVQKFFDHLDVCTIGLTDNICQMILFWTIKYMAFIKEGYVVYLRAGKYDL